jgi:hypothetical protein
LPRVVSSDNPVDPAGANRGRLGWIERDRLRDRRHRVLVAAVRIQDDAEQVQRIGRLGRLRENFAIEGLGLGERAALVMRDRLA